MMRETTVDGRRVLYMLADDVDPATFAELAAADKGVMVRPEDVREITAGVSIEVFEPVPSDLTGEEMEAAFQMFDDELTQGLGVAPAWPDFSDDAEDVDELMEVTVPVLFAVVL